VTGPTVRRPLAVLFDLDDTLFDHARATRVALGALREVDSALGRWSIDELDRRHRVVLEMWHQEVLAGRASIEQARIARFAELVGQAGGDGADHRAGALASQYRSVYETTWFTVPGARPLLEAIVEQGLRVAVVTNNVRQEQEIKLARCGLTSLVGTLVTSEEVGVQKPDPRIFQTALDRIGVSAPDAVMVGDAWLTDVEGARRAGLRPVWLNRFGETSRDASVRELRALEPLPEVLQAIVGD
jgi:HAD superfamily hydrolase (TIGR01662 family)